MGTSKWNDGRSLKLSLICTKIVIGLVIASAVAVTVWYLMGGETSVVAQTSAAKSANGETISSRFSEHVEISIVRTGSSFAFVAVIYVVCAIALAALCLLHGMLSRIRRGDVFSAGNVQALRRISWLCFACALALVCGAYVCGLSFILIGLMAAFVGLILRVVKNVFAAAVEIKTENDFTV